MARTHYHGDIRHGEGPCPSPYCGCDGCDLRCAGCGLFVGEWTGETVDVISQRAYCEDCAELASQALSDAIRLLIGEYVEGAPLWRHPAALAQPRINAALHLTRLFARSRHRSTSWPTSVEVA